jgi:hypothetical protein
MANANQYNSKWLYEYLKYPHPFNGLKSIKAIENAEHFDQGLRSTRCPETQDTTSYQFRQIHMKVIEYCIGKEFELKKTIESFARYFNKEQLIEFWEEWSFLRGDKVAVTPNNQSKLEQLTKSAEITLCEYNKDCFEVADNVTLSIRIKNVDKLSIKVFEINTLNYYKQNQKQFSTDINLDGLTSSIELSYQYSQSPQIVHTESYTFPTLKGKPGLFIIEIMGNGKSSRAVIKKGSLGFVEQATIAGQCVFIIDSNKNICNAPDSGMWLNETFYQCNAEKGGRIMIPYAVRSDTCKAILCHQGMAQLIEFTRLQESYKFECSFVLHSESVLMGKKATILVRPSLKLNGLKADLRMLETPKIELQSVNYIDNIPITQSFGKVEISDDKEIEIPFQVPPFLQSLKITFTATVMNATRNSRESVMSEKSFELISNCSNASVTAMYLKHTKDMYELFVYGKNGEPIPQANVRIEVLTNFLRSGSATCYLDTDDEGKIVLGKLHNAITVKAQCNSLQLDQSWALPQNALFHIPQKIDVLEQEPIELPVIAENTSNKFISLIKLKDGMPYAQHYSNIKVTKELFYSLISINGLQEGLYELRIDTNYISVEVHKGTHWQNDKFILKKGCLIKCPAYTKPMKIKEAAITEQKGTKSLVLKIEDFTPKCRVHVYMSQFLPNSLDQYSNSFLLNYSNRMEEYPFPMWKNFYLSNRALGDELRYIYERKNGERYMGNTLAKPQLLLKRLFIQTTHTNKEQLESGTAYDRVAENAPMRKVKCDEKQRRSSSISPSALTNKVYCMQNFMSVEPFTRLNMKPDTNGIIKLELSNNEYNTLYIVAVDEDAVCHQIIDSANKLLLKRNLAQLDVLSSAKNYSECRGAINVAKHETLTIKDLTSTEVMLVDSLDRVAAIQKKLAVGSSKAYCADFDFLSEWGTYSNDEKNAKYSKFFCHELNMYIKYKDPTYFKSVVAPHLMSKMEKQLLDYCLLGDRRMVDWACPHRFKELNGLEQCLLVEGLSLIGEDKLCSEMVGHMRSAEESNKRPATQYNWMFDTILSLNKMMEQSRLPETEKMLYMEKKECEFNKCDRMMDECQDDSEEAEEDEPEMLGCTDDAIPEHKMKKKPMIMNALFGKREELLKERKVQKVDFEPTEETKEFAETHYYNITNPSDYINRAAYAPLWLDYAIHASSHSKSPFLSSGFIYSISTLTENVAALALLDLPQHTQEHGYKTNEGRGATINAASNLMAFTKEIKEGDADIKNNVIVTQRYYTLTGPSDQEVTEFLSSEVYRCEVVITNISNKSIDLQYLIQIPEGSLPVGKSPFMKAFPCNLSSYTTKRDAYTFYFPAPGKYRHFGTTVSVNSIVIAKSPERELIVNKEKTVINKENFLDILSANKNEDILSFIKSKNILDPATGYSHRLIYWKLSEQPFFVQLIDILRAKLIYDDRVWQYSFNHRHEKGIAEWLNNSVPFKKRMGYYISSPLIQITPSGIGYRHLDYFPLINARAHKLGEGDKAAILNSNLKETYRVLIEYLFEKPTISSVDYLNLCFYLLLQSKISEVVTLFSKINPSELGGISLQYDYMKAYIDFFVGGPQYKAAREVVAKYGDYPVNSWKALMDSIRDQLSEYDGKQVDIAINKEEEESKEKNKLKTIALEPQLNFRIEGKSLEIQHINVPSVIIKYYLIDLEVLFSRSPFLMNSTKDFSYVQPHSLKTLILTNEKQMDAIAIPDEYVTQNVVIEIAGCGIQRFETYYASTLRVAVLEKFGEVKMTDSAGVVLSRVYVKAFARMKSGSVAFYKDGYTDMRGRFDYVSLNTQDLPNVERFALFIMSDAHGSCVKECVPPKANLNME